MRPGALPARCNAATSNGINSTTTGVSFITQLAAPAPTSTASSARLGDFCTSQASRRAAGASAPVNTSAWPSTISAKIATKAGWPKPAKKRYGSTSGSGARKNVTGSNNRIARHTELISKWSQMKTAKTTAANAMINTPWPDSEPTARGDRDSMGRETNRRPPRQHRRLSRN